MCGGARSARGLVFTRVLVLVVSINAIDYSLKNFLPYEAIFGEVNTRKIVI